MKVKAVAKIAALFLVTGAAAQVRAEDTQKETQKACQDVKSLNSAIRNLSNLDKDSTVKEAKAAEERVDKAISNLEKSAKKARPEQYKALKDARDDYEKALSEAPDTATVGQVENKVAGSRERLSTAYQDMKQSLNCPEHVQIPE